MFVCLFFTLKVPEVLLRLDRGRVLHSKGWEEPLFKSNWYSSSRRARSLPQCWERAVFVWYACLYTAELWKRRPEPHYISFWLLSWDLVCIVAAQNKLTSWCERSISACCAEILGKTFTHQGGADMGTIVKIQDSWNSEHTPHKLSFFHTHVFFCELWGPSVDFYYFYTDHTIFSIPYA